MQLLQILGNEERDQPGDRVSRAIARR